MRALAPILVAASVISVIACAPAEAMTIPHAIEGRNLTDASQVRVNPADGAQLTVVVFLSARCPCSMSHEPVLAALAREFGKEARFIGVHSNADETAQESAEHFKSAALPFPVLQDDGDRLADAFGALKTPHAFVLSKSGEVLFQGGVDDSHDASRASRPYLKTALESLRAGRPLETTLARSIGCKIRR